MVRPGFWLALYQHLSGLEPCKRPLAILGNGPEILPVARRQRFGWLNAAFETVSAELVAAAQADGIRVMIWTMDQPELLAHYAGLGVSKVCTNCPALLLQALKQG